MRLSLIPTVYSNSRILSLSATVSKSETVFKSLFGVLVMSLLANFSLVFKANPSDYCGVGGVCLCAHAHLSILFLDTGALKWLGAHQLG